MREWKRALIVRIRVWRLRNALEAPNCPHDGTPPLCYSCAAIVFRTG